MADTSNEFTNSPDDARIRPYNVRLTRHEETPATIIISGGEPVENEFPVPPVNINYFNTFNSKVFSMSSQGIDEARIFQKEAEAQGNSALMEANQRAASILEMDGSRPYYGIFNNFSLTDVQESNDQIVKLHVNFGADWNAFFFGDSPRVYQFSGVFIDSKEYPYYQEFSVAYDKYLKGRRAIEKKMTTIMSYDGKLVDVYILNLSVKHSGADQLIKPFQFTALIKSTSWLRSNFVYNSFGQMTRESFGALSNRHRISRYIANGIAGEQSGK